MLFKNLSCCLVLQKIKEFVLAVFVPRVCFCCNALIVDNIRCCNFTVNDINAFSDVGQNFFCKQCCEKMDVYMITHAFCKKCGYPMRTENFLDKNKQCESCREYKPVFDLARSCYCYKNQIRKMLLNFKFYSFYGFLRFFGCAMYTTYRKQMKTADYVCFIPVTRKKLFFKGFNHACELAKMFCKIAKHDNMDIPILYDLVVKTNTTMLSKTLHQHDRLLKKHCFKINNKYLKTQHSEYTDLNNKTLLVIDDVMTTGGTLNAFAKVIKNQFPKCQIECLTFARTMLW